MTLEPNVEMVEGVEEVIVLARKSTSDTNKHGKSSSHLGILQKDGKKGGLREKC